MMTNEEVAALLNAFVEGIKHRGQHLFDPPRTCHLCCDVVSVGYFIDRLSPPLRVALCIPCNDVKR